MILFQPPRNKMGNARPIFRPYILLALTSIISPFAIFSQSQKLDPEINAIFLQVIALKDGKYVTDLKESDFQIFEDKIPQRITKYFTPDDPFSVVVALDSSTTSRTNLKEVQNEAISLVNSLGSQNSIAVLSFGKQVKLLQGFAANRIDITSAISGITASGPTPLYDAVGFALETILHPVHGRTALVLFTDGFDNASRLYGREKILESAKASRTVIYCIYDDAPEEFLKGSNAPVPIVYEGRIYATTLSECTGGKRFNFSQVKELSREFANQYTLGYLPARGNGDGKIHKIEVRVSREGVKIRTRKEYFAPKISKP